MHKTKFKIMKLKKANCKKYWEKYKILKLMILMRRAIKKNKINKLNILILFFRKSIQLYHLNQRQFPFKYYLKQFI